VRSEGVVADPADRPSEDQQEEGGGADVVGYLQREDFERAELVAVFTVWVRDWLRCGQDLILRPMLLSAFVDAHVCSLTPWPIVGFLSKPSRTIQETSPSARALILRIRSLDSE